MSRKLKILDRNPFELFDDHPDYSEATLRLQGLIDTFIEDLNALQNKYVECGAADSASREVTAIYIAKNGLRLISL